MDDITANFFEYLLKDLLIILIILLVQYLLTTYALALFPIEVSRVAISNQQTILANLTTTELVSISNSTIKFNVVLQIIIEVLDLTTPVFLISDTWCYLKAKQSKRSLNY
jgi:Na+-transporting NADH:ubiquinone oxidoreductase subunit NqrC